MSLCQHVHIADISRREEEHYVLLDSYGEQGWPRSENNRLPPMCPGFDSRTRCHMWIESIVGSLLCSERFFFSGFPVFSSPQKPTFPNSNSILECMGFSERALVNSLVLLW